MSVLLVSQAATVPEVRQVPSDSVGGRWEHWLDAVHHGQIQPPLQGQYQGGWVWLVGRAG